VVIYMCVCTHVVRIRAYIMNLHICKYVYINLRLYYLIFKLIYLINSNNKNLTISN
jgi:hypothetical protein